MPALADVGAMGALADGMQIERARQALEVVVVFAYGGARLEPVRLGSLGFAEGLDLHQVHHDFIVAAGPTLDISREKSTNYLVFAGDRMAVN